MTDRFSSHHRRRQFLIRPKAQLRPVLILLVGQLLFSIVIFSGSTYWTSTSMEHLVWSQGLDPEMGRTIQRFLWSNLLVIALALIGVTMAFVTWGVVMNHRIFGPLVPINRHIGRLMNGEYSGRIRLRERDELKDLRDALNDLTTQLEKQHGRSL